MYLLNYNNTLLLHILFIFFVDNNKKINLLNPKYDFLRLFNYNVWTILSLYVLIYQKNIFLIGDFITKSIILNYIYEIIYHKPDKAHIMHHIITIMTQLLSIYSGCSLYSL